MIFINTRPANRAELLSNALQDRGLTVLELPLLTLTPINISECEYQYQQDFYQKPNAYHALVVVSPTAARMGLAACPDGFVPSCAVIAVGHTTAEVLRQADWTVQCPDEYSNEGMMRMAELSSLQAGDKVLIWRGRGGRRLLVNHLQDKEIVVDAIAWYQRHIPVDAEQNFKAMQQQLDSLKQADVDANKEPQDSLLSHQKPIALVSSGEAFTNWRLLLDSKDATLKLIDFNYLTFGMRLTQTLQDLQLSCARIEHLDVDEVWRGIERLSQYPE